ncbi:glycosyltransferase [Candidatus Gracilibacteria bacterium]|nr:glycosyltransferase [Candidatus Gracilibacteria bacterium]NJM86017.1 glycosyltransferase [Hydrococcus sp. RU_2_2]
MISIVTPVYNGEAFIESCIKVAIAQNCSDIEHIIVDGGSSDRTVEIIKNYARNYPHIRWISEKDKGQSDAMNKGISMAKGDILAILNVDDFYEPNVLNRIVEIFKTLPEPSLLVGNCNILGEGDRLLNVQKPAKLSLYDFLQGFEINPPPPNPSAYFYHKSLHQKVGLYEVRDHYSMDLDFLFKAVQVANVKYLDETWGNFRYVSGTKSFDSAANGNFKKNYQNLIRSYIKDLPLPQRILMFWKWNLLTRIKYFSRHPDEIFVFLLKKIKRS